MIFGTKSNYMLKYQKAKAKLVEYDIPQKDYPKFPLDSNELSYPVIYIISRYAESIIEDDTPGQEEFAPYIVKASQYFDAAVGAKDRTPYDADFLLSGSAAYFLSNDFGSSKVLCATLFERAKDISTMGVSQIILRNLLGYLLLDRAFPMVSDTSGGEKLCRALSFYYISGDGLPKIQQSMREYREAIYRSNDSMEIYYVDILLAVITIALSKASWKLLPQYSKLEPKEWAEYLKSSKAPKMLWPAQQLIGEKDVLNGANAIVQLPTGVGKTKSIELIIRSSFTSNRTTTAIIVAPLCALCNEIASDLAAAFGESVLINQFSDILENDFFVDVTQKSTLLICTPEKLNYIIHHQMEFLDGIGLYIFDESHMFDDENRGTAYELLISEIRKHINVKKQIVLLSAVLSNAEQIRQWLFNENGVLASDPSIKTTPKSIGFASQTRDIHYYSEDSEQEDFYVPRSIEIVSLKKLGKERKKRYFPELADAKDIAIYYANKLCRNGGAAIFANQARSVQTIIRRIIELDSRGYDLSGIRKCSNTLEMNRIAKLVADHYGYEHPYAKACLMGVAPHYSSLPNGVRLAVEYSFRKKDLHLVICTSTLAQGVNIPIKYLFMTSFMLNQNSMKVRNFQNLMGRTARSGMYTEGSVIVTDPKLFDNKSDRIKGGFYKWEDCVKMFDSHAAEPCKSSILWLVQNIKINYKLHIEGAYIANYIINNYSQPNCFKSCFEGLLQTYEEKTHIPLNENSAVTLNFALAVRQHVVEAIENHLCFVLSNDENADAQIVASETCKGTFAYFIANDAEKELLIKIFNAIAQKVKTVNREEIKRYSETMLGINDSLVIETWLAENHFVEQSLTDSEILEMLLSFFMDTHPIRKSKEYFQMICRMWLNGDSFVDMKKETGVQISDIEDICNKLISYEFSFFIGNIIDVIDAADDEGIAILISKLLLLQKKLKYGVCSETAISICEKVFNDRLLANSIAGQIRVESIDTNHIIEALKTCKNSILKFLSVYPTYFSARINWLCR